MLAFFYKSDQSSLDLSSDIEEECTCEVTIDDLLDDEHTNKSTNFFNNPEMNFCEQILSAYAFSKLFQYFEWIFSNKNISKMSSELVSVIFTHEVPIIIKKT